jgi:hypothetical protein
MKIHPNEGYFSIPGILGNFSSEETGMNRVFALKTMKIEELRQSPASGPLRGTAG